MATGRVRWQAAYAGVVLGVLAIVGSYYDRQTGLTVFLNLPSVNHAFELPAVRGTVHAHDEIGLGYDGQFYAQMAVDPLLRNPEIDRALDRPGYRAHRVLLSWIAWAAALGGDAAARLEAYAWINVAAWLLMAWILLRWLPPDNAKHFVLWAGILVGHGWLSSIRNALTDGPSVLLIAGAVAAIEGGRPWLAAVVTGISGLARETNVLVGAALMRHWRPTVRGWLSTTAMGIVCVLPLVMWLDYLRSIYRDGVFAGGGHMTTPLVGFAFKVRATIEGVMQTGVSATSIADVTATMAIVGQVVALVWLTRGVWRERQPVSSWLIVSWMFGLLTLAAHPVIWEGHPGAFPRVLLPLSVGINILLARQSTPWWLILWTNLMVVSGLMTFVWGWV